MVYGLGLSNHLPSSLPAPFKRENWEWEWLMEDMAMEGLKGIKEVLSRIMRGLEETGRGRGYNRGASTLV